VFTSSPPVPTKSIFLVKPISVAACGTTIIIPLEDSGVFCRDDNWKKGMVLSLGSEARENREFVREAGADADGREWVRWISGRE